MSDFDYRTGQRFASKSELTHPQFEVTAVLGDRVYCQFLYQSGEKEKGEITFEDIKKNGYELSYQPKFLTEKQFVRQRLESTWGWKEMIDSGRAGVADLKDGELKTLIRQYEEIESKLSKKLDQLGYEAQ